MSCYHPMKAFTLGVKENGRKDLKITSYETNHVELIHGSWVSVGSPFVSELAKVVRRDFQEIPCGKCIGCRLDYSRQWANRCMLELQYCRSAYFVTLTYDDFHVPHASYTDLDTGELLDCLTLRKRDFQLFMKRLRKEFGDGIRFFACGEYGSSTFRPHYHAILFNLHLDDLEVYKRVEQGFTYYNSPRFSACWSECSKGYRRPIGFAVLANVTWETCAYVARYVTKKLKGAEADFYSLHNIEPEFCLMSRKPGIARQYFEDHPDVMEYEYINVSTAEGGRKFRPPRYYDYLYDLTVPDDMADLKDKRRLFAEELTKAKMDKTELTYLEQLQVEEDSKLSKIKSLRRDQV